MELIKWRYDRSKAELGQYYWDARNFDEVKHYQQLTINIYVASVTMDGRLAKIPTTWKITGVGEERETIVILAEQLCEILNSRPK